MAAYAGEDDFYTDDDLDALPSGTLAELEHNAIQLTQHHRPTTKPVQSSDYGDEFEDDDLDDALVYEESEAAPPRQLQPHTTGHTVTQHEQFRLARYGGVSNAPSIAPSIPNRTIPSQTIARPLTNSTHTARSLGTQRRDVFDGVKNHADDSATSDVDVAALQQQIQSLLRAQEELKRDLNIRTGEIAIVRSKQEKATKEYERELVAVRKLNAERLASQQKAIDAARDAERIANTELKFAKQDLQEESERVRNLRRLKEKDKDTINEATTTTTPRKTKSAIYRDGFDDEEIQFGSPSKVAGRKSNQGTPSRPTAKKKRRAPDSPAVPLDLEQADDDSKRLPPNAVVLDEVLLDRLRRPDDRLDFLESMLRHRRSQVHRRTFEEFGNTSFPDVKKSFATVILDEVSLLPAKRAPEFPIVFCNLLISLWMQCFDKKFYEPMCNLIDLLTFAVELKTTVVAPQIIDDLLPLAQKSAELVAVLRFKREPYAKIAKDVDVSACLRVMHLAAQGCMKSMEHTIRFWRLMRLDFVLMILSQHQPVPDFEAMLRLLAMSALSDSVGPKVMDQDTQQVQVHYIFDRMSLLLVTTPSLQADQAKHEVKVIIQLRMQILQTFHAFCQSAWGGEAVALDRYVIGRLVKLASDELDSLYDYLPTHKESAHLISLAVRLLHYLITKHDRLIKMQEKLAVIHGGTQKYMLCLARLNFAEDDLLFDEDMDPNVAEWAHEMLELAVTPEEGDAIHAAFVPS